ncbi:MAG: alpha/beta fold hydrolase [Pseudomonadota bacterium]
MPRSRTLRYLLIVIALAALAFALGPRAALLDEPAALVIGEDLDAYLSRAEARFGDVTPGTEKRVVWADADQREPTPVALVYLHGFSATRQETAPLTETVAERLGANVYYARLSGHGRGSAAMGEARAGDWLNDTREALAIGQVLGERVIVVGVSTGATLATWAAAEQPETVDALVLISPNYAVASPLAGILTWPWGRQIAKLIAGRDYSFEPLNEPHGRYWTTAYPIDATVELMALLDYVNALPGGAVVQPVFYVRSNRDIVIDPERADRRVAAMPNPANRRLVVTDTEDPYGHVIAGDILSPGTTDAVAGAIVGFIDDVLPATN